MNIARKLFVIIALLLVSLNTSAHTIDITKSRLEKTDTGLRLTIQANLWAVFFEKPVAEISSDDYQQVIGPAQVSTLRDELIKALAFIDADGSAHIATIAFDPAMTDPKTRETPVTFDIDAPRIAIQTAENFGTLIVVAADGQTLIAPNSKSELLPALGSKWEVFKQYVILGFEHILPLGVDHVLFVLSLFLLAPALRPLLLQVSAFTVAHTISLALASLNIVSVSASIVEPLIAFSIFYMAVENVFAKELKKWRVGVVFAFGLLHGLGFAGVLAELGLPREAFAESLLGFNIGVEFGQLAVLALAMLAFGWFRKKTWYRSRILIPGSILIAVVGLYWTIERAFFG